MSSNRTVVESTRFQGERRQIEPNWRRFDDALEATYWALSRNPATAGIQIQGHRLWVLPLYSWSSEPVLAIYYTFDDEQVTLESVRLDHDELPP